MKNMRDVGSVIRGLKAMSHWYTFFQFWVIRFSKDIRFWAHWWTPKWHEGRGFYLTLGLGIIRIYRGY